jgi:hypothetical protein
MILLFKVESATPVTQAALERVAGARLLVNAVLLAVNPAQVLPFAQLAGNKERSQLAMVRNARLAQTSFPTVRPVILTASALLVATTNSLLSTRRAAKPAWKKSHIAKPALSRAVTNVTLLTCQMVIRPNV